MSTPTEKHDSADREDVEDTPGTNDNMVKQQEQEEPQEEAVDDEVDISKELPDDEEGKRHPFFHFMAKFPLPFLVVIPIIFAFLIGFGWSVDDSVEDKVASLWIAQNGDYAKNQAYAADLGVDDLSASTFAALAITRDGENIMTADRLEEIRARMEATEATEVTYKGVTYTWDDLCAISQAPYQFPCLRLSPMDLFQEARWTFTPLDRAAWYQSIQNFLVAPRVPRFGVMTNDCYAACFTVLLSRSQNPLALFADIGNMEYNHQCRVCIESKYEETIRSIHANIAPVFGLLRGELMRHMASLTDSAEDVAKMEELEDIATKLGTLAATVTGDDAADFYKYYVLRGLYAELGAASYLENYALFDPLIEACQASSGILGLNCPKRAAELTEEDAKQALFSHADGPHSSLNLAGSPYPFWSDEVTGGSMFGQNEASTLHGVSGSGVDMSGVIFSTAAYLDAENYGTSAWSPAYGSDGFADPSSPQWQAMVAVDPVYSWFMASLTPADEGLLCENGVLPGTDTVSDEFDAQSAGAAGLVTQSWCTPFNIPNPTIPGAPEIEYSKQYFARMWSDLLISSPSFLDIKLGEDDPYTWTSGAGCGYELAGSRFSYTNQSEEAILTGASRVVYNIDEGTSLGPADRNLLLGGTSPAVGEYNQTHPLETVKVMQTIYAALTPDFIVERVNNCNRPGGPVEITKDDAKEILYLYKEAWEDAWTEGWDNENAGEVQFVGFYDDAGDVVGSTGRMLEEITLDNTRLTVVAILLIAFFSAVFLFSFDLVESKVLVTLVGVVLVVVSFFAALGFGLLTGIKINVSIAWTLPFVMIGLGVDDVYIILLSLKQQGGYKLKDWHNAMAEVVVPVTMTSLINASMFAILNVSDIPAIYLTSRMACYSVIALYLSVVFCFPAYCLYDLKRQEAGRLDVAVCIESKDEAAENHATKKDFREAILYDSFYKQLVLSENATSRSVVHFIIVAISLTVFGVGIYGINEREVGLGLEDFFPDSNPAYRWAQVRTEELASWSVAIRWGELDYSDGSTQMKMIKQFEDVVATPYIAEIDTKQLWIADFAIWTTKHCSSNFDRDDFDERECGYNQVFEGTEGPSFCSGSWMPNEFGLRVKDVRPLIEDTCTPYEGGICRTADEMFESDLAELGETVTSAGNQTFCPVTNGWSEEKFQFCIAKWRNITGTSDRFVTVADTATETACSGVTFNDAELVHPMPFSTGPSMFAFGMNSHELTLDMIRQTRAVCDDDKELHCWMTGIPFDYWSQYEEVFPVLVELSGYAALAGFVIAFIFLFGSFVHQGGHEMGSIFGASLTGALLILITIIFTLVPVVGLSILWGVNLTGFSNMAFVLSVGFAVEYSVHIISRWMRADNSIKKSFDRVEHTMSFLMVPTFMSFVSSTIGVICLAFTKFEFSSVFFFKPMLIVMFVTYWMGCWFLPTLLNYLDFDFVKMGTAGSDREEGKGNDVELKQ